jgi:hypothetical protein
MNPNPANNDALLIGDLPRHYHKRLSIAGAAAFASVSNLQQPIANLEHPYAISQLAMIAKGCSRSAIGDGESAISQSAASSIFMP